MRMPRALRDPAAPGLAVFGVVVATGIVVIGIGWRVVARTVVVGEQVPAIVSGGLGGLALVILGVGLALVHLSRREALEERAEADALLEEVATLLEEVRRTKAAASATSSARSPGRSPRARRR